MTKPVRVLHVTDCFDGGVATAVNQYAGLTPEYSHLLLANNARSSAPVAGRAPGVFAVDQELPEEPVAAIAAIRRAVSAHRPDVIHAHSSFAGAYARIASLADRVTPGRTAVPVVYTPHSFAFERADIPAWKSRVFRLMEQALYPLTGVGAPCAEWEGELMLSLDLLGTRIPGRPGRVPVVVVPNALAGDHPAEPDSWSPPADGEPPVIGVVSRVTPQRDPAFFAETARLIRAERPGTRFTWIGDGDGKDSELVDLLEDAGVEVTGWLSGDELRARVAGLSLVIHTARWDGFPMAVLEVRRIGVPLLVRDIPALQECPATARFDTPRDAAAKALEILDDGRDPSHWTSLDKAHTPERQRTTLREAYDLALRGGKVRV
ncbi:MAG: glycosyltransferase [Corynebacterium sp.]|uniref:glycosyltransferase n=1 Tax=Corynebacterium sp. TaxID=1720 RepID=UPI003F9D39AF